MANPAPSPARGGRFFSAQWRLVMTTRARVSIGILYEHPDWYRPLFDELDRRGTSYVKLHADTHAFDPGEEQAPFDLLFNRMSPSGWQRGRQDAVFYTLQYLAHLQRLGVRVINGYDAWRTEISKAFQLSLLESLELPYP